MGPQIVRFETKLAKTGNVVHFCCLCRKKLYLLTNKWTLEFHFYSQSLVLFFKNYSSHVSKIFITEYPYRFKIMAALTLCNRADVQASHARAT